MIEHLSRKEIKCQMFDSYKEADDLDAKILDIFLAYMDKLPDETLLNHTIKETELITKFLDPILNGMLNDHDTDHNFMWTNTRSTGTEDERPDAEMVILRQRTIDYTVGYCEVKISESGSNTIEVHNDMVRLARFGKKLCDEEDLDGSLLAMVVVLKSPNVYPPFQVLLQKHIKSNRLFMRTIAIVLNVPLNPQRGEEADL
ncbi:hypothetical protein G6F56_008718 [Rhizopus delemar]|nr:hypothetical protein G6F56_008718 [Rhizopus delemar]